MYKSKPSNKMEFSKKLIIFTSAIYLISWIMAAYSLFVLGEIPFELLQYANILYGASVVSYCGKAAYENKAKIDKWGSSGFCESCSIMQPRR